MTRIVTTKELSAVLGSFRSKNLAVADRSAEAFKLLDEAVKRHPEPHAQWSDERILAAYELLYVIARDAR